MQGRRVCGAWKSWMHQPRLGRLQHPQHVHIPAPHMQHILAHHTHFAIHSARKGIHKRRTKCSRRVRRLMGPLAYTPSTHCTHAASTRTLQTAYTYSTQHTANTWAPSVHHATHLPHPSPPTRCLLRANRHAREPLVRAQGGGEHHPRCEHHRPGGLTAGRPCPHWCCHHQTPRGGQTGQRPLLTWVCARERGMHHCCNCQGALP